MSPCRASLCGPLPATLPGVYDSPIPQGLQAAPSLPDQRGWRDSSRLTAIPSPWLPNRLHDPGTFFPSPSLMVLAFLNHSRSFDSFWVEADQVPPGHRSWERVCTSFSDTLTPYLLLPLPMLTAFNHNSDSVLICLDLRKNGILGKGPLYDLTGSPLLFPWLQPLMEAGAEWDLQLKNMQRIFKNQSLLGYCSCPQWLVQRWPYDLRWSNQRLRTFVD